MKTLNRQTIVRMVAAAIIALGVPTASHAQLGGLLNKAKEKAKQVVGNTTIGNKAVDAATGAVAQGTLPPLPWSMVNEVSTHSKNSEYLKNLETHPEQDLATLRDQMVARYTANERLKGVTSENNRCARENEFFIEFYRELVQKAQSLLTYDPIINPDGTLTFKSRNNGAIIMSVPQGHCSVYIENGGQKVYFAEQPFGSSSYQPHYVSAEDMEGVKKDFQLARCLWVMLDVKDKGIHPYVEENYYKEFRAMAFYTQYLSEAIKNNSPANITRQEMPKPGAQNKELHAQALAIEKSIKDGAEVLDVIVTSNAWDVQREGGVIVRRVASGYVIVKDKQGKAAVRVSWAQDHQGGGKYGALRRFGNGGSFLVK